MDPLINENQRDNGWEEARSPAASGHFGSCLKSFEVHAATLERGFRTALFVQRFKSGLLGSDELKSQRLQ